MLRNGKTLSQLFWRTNDLRQAELPTWQCGSGGSAHRTENGWTHGCVLSVCDTGRRFSLRCLVIEGLEFGERGSCRSFTYD